MAEDAAMILVNRLLGQAQALAAVIAYPRLSAAEDSADPELRSRVEEVVDVLGARDALDSLTDRERNVVIGFARSYLHQALELADHPGRANAWSHDDPAILQAQGAASTVVASLIAHTGLGADGDRILDVGTGVAGLAIAFCETFADSTVVGLDPWEPALALARGNVANANLESRITLVPLPIQEYEDADGFDLVWLPSFFIPEAFIDDALRRVRTLLRPDGRVVVGVMERAGDALARAVDAMITVRSGGAVLETEQGIERLQQAGFARAFEADRTWQAPLRFVVGTG